MSFNLRVLRVIPVPDIQMLIPCLDNRLSAYLNQKSIYRDVWRRRWFILTNWLLVCFEDHTVQIITMVQKSLFYYFCNRGKSPLGHYLCQVTESHCRMW